MTKKVFKQPTTGNTPALDVALDTDKIEAVQAIGGDDYMVLFAGSAVRVHQEKTNALDLLSGADHKENTAPAGATGHTGTHTKER